MIDVDIDAIKDYMKKLQKVINFDATFSIAGFKLIQKRKIEDVLCCVYAKLPEAYKKMLKTKVDVQRYNSVLCYSLLMKLLSKKFFLDKNLIIVRVNEVNKLISAVIVSIDRDISTIEQLLNRD